MSDKFNYSEEGYPDQITVENSWDIYGAFHVPQLYELGEHQYDPDEPENFDDHEWEEVQNPEQFRDEEFDYMEMDAATAGRLQAAYNATLGIPRRALSIHGGNVIQEMIDFINYLASGSDKEAVPTGIEMQAGIIARHLQGKVE